MSHLLQSLMGKIVTIGFIYGLVLLFLRILDEFTPERIKQKFNVFVTSMESTTSSWSLGQLSYSVGYYTLAYAIFYCLSFALICARIDSALDIEGRFDINQRLLFLYCGYFTGIGLWFLPEFCECLQRPHWKKQLFQFVWHLLAILLLPIYCISLGVQTFFPEPDPLLTSGYVWQSQNLGSWLGPLTPVCVMAPGILLVMLPVLFLIAIRAFTVPLTKFVWWLATYPRGAWAGAMFVSTIALGILRLI